MKKTNRKKIILITALGLLVPLAGAATFLSVSFTVDGQSNIKNEISTVILNNNFGWDNAFSKQPNDQEIKNLLHDNNKDLNVNDIVVVNIWSGGATIVAMENSKNSYTGETTIEFKTKLSIDSIIKDSEINLGILSYDNAERDLTEQQIKDKIVAKYEIGNPDFNENSFSLEKIKSKTSSRSLENDSNDYMLTGTGDKFTGSKEIKVVRKIDVKTSLDSIIKQSDFKGDVNNIASDANIAKMKEVISDKYSDLTEQINISVSDSKSSDGKIQKILVVTPKNNDYDGLFYGSATIVLTLKTNISSIITTGGNMENFTTVPTLDQVKTQFKKDYSNFVDGDFELIEANSNKTVTSNSTKYKVIGKGNNFDGSATYTISYGLVTKIDLATVITQDTDFGWENALGSDAISSDSKVRTKIYDAIKTKFKIEKNDINIINFGERQTDGSVEITIEADGDDLDKQIYAGQVTVIFKQKTNINDIVVKAGDMGHTATAPTIGKAKEQFQIDTGLVYTDYELVESSISKTVTPNIAKYKITGKGDKYDGSTIYTLNYGLVTKVELSKVIIPDTDFGWDNALASGATSGDSSTRATIYSVVKNKFAVEKNDINIINFGERQKDGNVEVTFESDGDVLDERIYDGEVKVIFKQKTDIKSVVVKNGDFGHTKTVPTADQAKDVIKKDYPEFETDDFLVETSGTKSVSNKTAEFKITGKGNKYDGSTTYELSYGLVTKVELSTVITPDTDFGWDNSLNSDASIDGSVSIINSTKTTIYNYIKEKFNIDRNDILIKKFGERQDDGSIDVTMVPDGAGDVDDQKYSGEVTVSFRQKSNISNVINNEGTTLEHFTTAPTADKAKEIIIKDNPSLLKDDFLVEAIGTKTVNTTTAKYKVTGHHDKYDGSTTYTLNYGSVTKIDLTTVITPDYDFGWDNALDSDGIKRDTIYPIINTKFGINKPDIYITNIGERQPDGSVEITIGPDGSLDVDSDDKKYSGQVKLIFKQKSNISDVISDTGSIVGHFTAPPTPTQAKDIIMKDNPTLLKDDFLVETSGTKTVNNTTAKYKVTGNGDKYDGSTIYTLNYDLVTKVDLATVIIPDTDFGWDNVLDSDASIDGSKASIETTKKKIYDAIEEKFDVGRSDILINDFFKNQEDGTVEVTITQEPNIDADDQKYKGAATVIFKIKKNITDIISSSGSGGIFATTPTPTQVKDAIIKDNPTLLKDDFLVEAIGTKTVNSKNAKYKVTGKGDKYDGSFTYTFNYSVVTKIDLATIIIPDTDFGWDNVLDSDAQKNGSDTRTTIYNAIEEEFGAERVDINITGFEKDGENVKVTISQEPSIDSNDQKYSGDATVIFKIKADIDDVISDEGTTSEHFTATPTATQAKDVIMEDNPKLLRDDFLVETIGTKTVNTKTAKYKVTGKGDKYDGSTTFTLSYGLVTKTSISSIIKANTDFGWDNALDSDASINGAGTKTTIYDAIDKKFGAKRADILITDFKKSGENVKVTISQEPNIASDDQKYDGKVVVIFKIKTNIGDVIGDEDSTSEHLTTVPTPVKAKEIIMYHYSKLLKDDFLVENYGTKTVDNTAAMYKVTGKGKKYDSSIIYTINYGLVTKINLATHKIANNFFEYAKFHWIGNPDVHNAVALTSLYNAIDSQFGIKRADIFVSQFTEVADLIDVWQVTIAPEPSISSDDQLYSGSCIIRFYVK